MKAVIIYNANSSARILKCNCPATSS